VFCFQHSCGVCITLLMMTCSIFYFSHSGGRIGMPCYVALWSANNLYTFIRTVEGKWCFLTLLLVYTLEYAMFIDSHSGVRIRPVFFICVDDISIKCMWHCL